MGTSSFTIRTRFCEFVFTSTWALNRNVLRKLWSKFILVNLFLFSLPLKINSSSFHSFLSCVYHCIIYCINVHYVLYYILYLCVYIMYCVFTVQSDFTSTFWISSKLSKNSGQLSIGILYAGWLPVCGCHFQFFSIFVNLAFLHVVEHCVVKN